MHGNDAFGSHDADPVMFRAISQALEKVRELRKSILETAVSDERAWFRNLLLGILNCALLDYESVEVGVQKSICLAAWGSRNLLELKVIATYVLTSEKNANDFKRDLLIDAKEFYEAVTKSHEATHTRLLSMMSESAEQEEDLMKDVFTEASQEEPSVARRPRLLRPKLLCTNKSCPSSVLRKMLEPSGLARSRV